MQKYENIIFPEVSFECKHCGKCCMYPPDLDKQEFDAIVSKGHKSFIDPDGGMIPSVAKKEDGYCCFLTENKMCLIHDIKPVGCISQPFFPFDYNIKNKTLEVKDVEDCPGIGKGKLTKEQLETFGKAAQKNLDFFFKLQALALKLPIDDKRVSKGVKQHIGELWECANLMRLMDD